MIKFLLCVSVAPRRLQRWLDGCPAGDSRGSQNGLFAEQWEQGLRENPRRRDLVAGDYRYNERLAKCYTATNLQRQRR